MWSDDGTKLNTCGSLRVKGGGDSFSGGNSTGSKHVRERKGKMSGMFIFSSNGNANWSHGRARNVEATWSLVLLLCSFLERHRCPLESEKDLWWRLVGSLACNWSLDLCLGHVHIPEYLRSKPYVIHCSYKITLRGNSPPSREAAFHIFSLQRKNLFLG